MPQPLESNPNHSCLADPVACMEMYVLAKEGQDDYPAINTWTCLAARAVLTQTDTKPLWWQIGELVYQLKIAYRQAVANLESSVPDPITWSVSIRLWELESDRFRPTPVVD